MSVFLVGIQCQQIEHLIAQKTKILYITENITDFGKTKMLLLTKEELKSYPDAKVCYIWGNKSSLNI